MEEEKAVNVQVLLDQLIRNVLIALDHTRQTSAEQLVENAMGATNWDITYEGVQTTRIAELISSTRKILKVWMLHKSTKLPPLSLEFKIYMEKRLANLRHCWILVLTQASLMKDFFIASG